MGATPEPGECGSSDPGLFETTSASSSPREKRYKEKKRLQEVLCICLEILENSKGNNVILQA